MDNGRQRWEKLIDLLYQVSQKKNKCKYSSQLTWIPIRYVFKKYNMSFSKSALVSHRDSYINPSRKPLTHINWEFYQSRYGKKSYYLFSHEKVDKLDDSRASYKYGHFLK